MGFNKLDSNDVDQIINSKKPCLIAFSREECHICQEVIPRVKEISERFEGKVFFYYVDVEEDKSILKKYFLKGVPQLLFFKDGELYGKLSGNVEEEDIEEKIAELV